MIAYNKTSLHNNDVRKQATAAFENNLLSADELQQIKEKYPVQFYTPNFFIRIGLFILTGIIVSFSFSLFSLVFMSSGENVWKGLLLRDLLYYGALFL